VASKWSTRADWGARSPRGVRTDIDPVGVAVHWYGGGSFKRANHKDCLALVKAAQNQHMSDPGVNDIMYNLAACHHGYLIEARSTQARPKVRSGANGTAAANGKWYAILALWVRVTANLRQSYSTHSATASTGSDPRRAPDPV